VSLTLTAARLNLIALSAEELRLYRDYPEALRLALGLARLHADMSEPLQRAVRIKLERMALLPVEQHPWQTYWLIVLTETQFGAGLIGFKGVPDAEGRAEVGYGIATEVEGQGYMTEALRRLAEWAWTRPEIRGITATVAPENIASQRVLEKSGFLHLGRAPDEPNLLAYELRRPKTSPLGTAPLPVGVRPGRISGERRQVTVLFADLSGFTTLSEQLDAEEVCGLLNASFDVLVPVIEKYGGVVDKFIGDEVMAVFGAPVAHEDDPARALRAALEMMTAMATFNAVHNTTLGLHVGINTGLVIAGGIGSQGQQHDTVIGSAVNLAARLKDISERGTIMLGPQTYRLTAPLFEFASLPPVLVKGLTEPVQAYALLGLKDRPGSVRGLAGMDSPMVGRVAELAALLQLSAAVQGGRGGAALVLGEPGLGKSRLIAEWRAALSGQTLRWGLGRCLSYSQQQAYSLIQDLLRSLLGTAPGAAPVEVAAALQAWLPAAESEAAYLRHLLGLPLDDARLAQIHTLDAQTLQTYTLNALHRLLLALAERTPLHLICEDIHWADASSVELLTRLLPLLNEAPVLLCAVSRAEPDSPGWRLVTAIRQSADLPNCHDLALNPLSPGDGRNLLKNIFHHSALPEALYDRILDRAGGNPFFVEEVVRMWVDQGVLVRGSGGWHTTHLTESVEIPDTLHALLLARMDRLPEPARRTLQVAAVLGRRFSARLLQEITGQHTAGLGLHLNTLRAAEIIVPAEVGTEDEYTFRHNLVQEAAYQSLLRDDRRDLHRAAAEALERLYPDLTIDLAHLLAHHYHEAGDTSRSLRYFVLAGDADFKRYAVAEAIGHYTHALEHARELGPDLPTSNWQHLGLQLGRALELDARYAEALAVYDELEALARQRAEEPLELAVLLESARLYCTPNPAFNPGRGAEYAGRALSLSQRLGDRAAEARVHWVLSLLYWLINQPDTALENGEISLKLARELNLREQLAFTLHDLTRPFMLVHRQREAMTGLDESRRLWRELNNLPMLADNLNTTADIYGQLRQPERELEYAAEAYELSRTIGNLWNQAFSRGLMGEAQQMLGHYPESILALRESLEVSKQAGLGILARRVLFELGWLLACLGDTDAARRVLFENQDQFGPQEGYVPFMVPSLGWLLLADIEILAGQVRVAEDDLRQAEALLPAEAEGRLPAALNSTRAQLAVIHNDEPAARQAVAALPEAIAQAHASSVDRTWLAYFYQTLAQTHLWLNELDSAAAEVEQGLALLSPPLHPAARRPLELLMAQVEARRGNAEAAAGWQAAAQTSARQALEVLASNPDLQRRYLALVQPATDGAAPDAAAGSGC
jgi:class 3 adenylate cyclase